MFLQNDERIHMKRLDATLQELDCSFDLEAYMFLSQNKRIDAGLAIRVAELWSKWKGHLKAYRLGVKKGYVVVFLDHVVEDEVDEIWNRTPSEGFEAQCVAQTMIMQSMRELMPEVAEQGCAPMPEPNKILNRSLEPLGLILQESGLNVKYGVITPFPVKEGCTACSLEASCPKKCMGPETWMFGGAEGQG
jgi:hypothetical protein